MRILCLHGTGSSSELFSNQTATLRAILNDVSFDFVQGTVKHDEASWAKDHALTDSSGQRQLYTYFEMLDFGSMLDAEEDLIDLLLHEKPRFDGILAYSGGCALAVQAFARHEARRDRITTPALFDFAVFCNGITPSKVWRLSEIATEPLAERADEVALRQKALAAVDGVVALRLLATPWLYEEIASQRQAREESINSLKPIVANGVAALANEKYGVSFFQSHQKLSIPTLHVRDENQPPELGFDLLQCCSTETASELLHSQGHEFPRGYQISRDMAQQIRRVIAKRGTDLLACTS